MAKLFALNENGIKTYKTYNFIEQSTLSTYAPLSSPALTGTPTSPTAAQGTNTTQIATTAFVTDAVTNAGGGDVTGPASAIDGDITLFNGSTGKIIKAVTPNTAFNKDFGTTSGTISAGDHNHDGVYEPVLGFTPEDSANKGAANGYCDLDANSLVPVSRIPSSFKEIDVVADITERDGLTTFEGLRAHVLDASADPTVDSGWAEYLWTGSSWSKTAEAESIDVVLSWTNITGKPTTVSGYGITDVYTKTESDSLYLGITAQAADSAKLGGELPSHYETAFTKNTAFNKDFGTTSGTVATGDHNHDGVYEPAFTKNTAFNKDFGTTVGTVAEGNHNHDLVYLGINATAAKATVLETARNINGVPFDGSTNISINTTSSLTFNDSGTGDASSVSFDGSAAKTISYNTIGAEPAFSKNTGFNKDFGTTSGTVAEGNHNHNGVYEPVLGFTPENIANKGAADGYCDLDSNSLVPVSRIPSNYKEIDVVADIAERDGITPFEGQRVHVLDASADSTVDSGWAEYLWTGSAWTKTAENESIDVVLSWSNITGKPTTISGYGITDAYTKTQSDTTFLGINATADKATVLATARTINGVSFDGSANISVNTVSALTFNDGGAGDASGASFNGSAAKTISYNTIGAEPAFSKNTGFNKNLGTVAGTVSEGNHNHDTAYLGITAQAADSDKLDGKEGSEYLSTTSQTLTSTATTTLDVLSYDNFIVTLDQDSTIAFSNLSSKIGASGTIVFKQDATGGWTFTLPSEAKTPLGQSIDQYTNANSVSTLMYFIVDASTVLVNYIGGWS